LYRFYQDALGLLTTRTSEEGTIFFQAREGHVTSCRRGVARRRVPGYGFRHGEDLAGADLPAA
jgi:hypothetical protein